MEEITIKISQGKATIEVKGIKGRSCLDATQEVEKRLGIAKSRKLTHEFHQSASAANKVSQR